MIRHLTQKINKMALDNDCVQDNANGPVEPPGHMGANLAQQPASGTRPPVVHPGDIHDKEVCDEIEDDEDPP